ncbi:MAG: aminoacyl-tRNA hydrolase [Candidatus Neomarinimicrobiota bacterium]|nr:aminoacyl-tRNA hydrolase [Candidatus Neomarinimicrobiota bacterium]MDD3965931.1 aminoacyl-tRNA hydrolase [Candidatus Neomarinimicrobiota bacterium]
MKTIVGLGNPGSRYRHTRHNVGFMLLDLLAERHGLRFKAGKGDYMIAVSEELDTAFVKPLTYMNESGLAIRDAVRRYAVQSPDLLVAHDELDLELGRFKFKAAGSAGTHKGIRSIIYHLDSDAFPRLKVGIDVAGRRESSEAVDYVLSKFSLAEKTLLHDTLHLAADAVECFLKEGLEKTMNMYHQRQ